MGRPHAPRAGRRVQVANGLVNERRIPEGRSRPEKDPVVGTVAFVFLQPPHGVHHEVAVY